MRTSTLLFGVWLGLLTVAALRPLANSAEPGRKPTLWLALDDNAASRMLRAELSRDWTRPNRAVILTPAQRRDLAEIGRRMNGVKEVIVRQFVIVYVGPESLPAARRFSLPALRINRGRWESIDRRAFAFETRPLLTLDWYRARYAALFDRDTAPEAISEYGCSDEGYSGPAEIETPPPWELPAVGPGDFPAPPR